MKLAKREKRLITAAALAIAVFLLSQFLVSPFFAQMNRVQRGISAQEEALKEILALRTEYLAHKREIQETDKAISERKKDFTLFSFLEETAGKAQVKSHIKYMKPSDFQVSGPYRGSIVEIKLEDITLKQLVNYLYHTESPEKIIAVKRMSIWKKKEGSGRLDALLQVVTLHRT